MVTWAEPETTVSVDAAAAIDLVLISLLNVLIIMSQNNLTNLNNHTIYYCSCHFASANTALCCGMHGSSYCLKNRYTRKRDTKHTSIQFSTFSVTDWRSIQDGFVWPVYISHCKLHICC